MKEYKVMLFNITPAKGPLQRLESRLNEVALEGWVLHNFQFRGKDHLLVILEQDRYSAPDDTAKVTQI